MESYIELLDALFALCSFASSFCLMRILFGRIRSYRGKPVVLNVLFFMTSSLCIYTFAQLCFSIPSIVSKHNIFVKDRTGKTICAIISGFGNFAFSSAILWYAVMSFILALLLSGYSMAWVRKTNLKQHAFVWTICCVSWITGFYPFIQAKDVSFYCWASPGTPKLHIFFFFGYYIPTLITMGLCIFVLILALNQLRRRKTILDITAFVGCFVIVWLIPSARAISVWLLGYREVAWLEIGHNMSISLAGIFHFQVWGSISSSIKRNASTFTIDSTLDQAILEGEAQPGSFPSYIFSTLSSDTDEGYGTPGATITHKLVNNGKSPAIDINRTNSATRSSWSSSLYQIVTDPTKSTVFSWKMSGIS